MFQHFLPEKKIKASKQPTTTTTKNPVRYLSFPSPYAWRQLEKDEIAGSMPSSNLIYHLRVEEEHKLKYPQVIKSSSNLLQSFTIESQSEIWFVLSELGNSVTQTACKASKNFSLPQYKGNVLQMFARLLAANSSAVI